jgi:uncharacterized protein
VTLLLLAAATAVAAALYASVGHGGASGYLAILALAGLAGPEVAATVLTMNLIVSSVSFGRYTRAGYLDLRLVLPFIIFSAPAAFVGGTLRVPATVFGVVLGVALLVAALRFLLPHPPGRQESLRPRRRTFWLAAALLGTVLGVLSGITGVGGGIYLSPLLLVLGWADAKTTAATAATFIFVNSATGLAGRLLIGQGLLPDLVPLMVAALIGGWFGAWWGAERAGNRTIKRVLGVVLLVAGSKLLLTA